MLKDALDVVEKEIADRVRNGGAPAPGTPEAVQLEEDKRRLRSIQVLRNSLADPTREKAITDAQGAAEQAGKLDVVDAYGQASGAALSSAAARGLLGSSLHQRIMGQAEAARDTGLRDVASSANDQATAIRQGDEAHYRDVLNAIAAPTNGSAASQQVILQGAGDQARAQVATDQVQSNARAALSQAVGGFLSNGVGGATKYAFDRADHLNTNNRINWIDGDRKTAKPTAESPWSVLFK